MPTSSTGLPLCSLTAYSVRSARQSSNSRSCVMPSTKLASGIAIWPLRSMRIGRLTTSLSSPARLHSVASCATDRAPTPKLRALGSPLPVRRSADHTSGNCSRNPRRRESRGRAGRGFSLHPGLLPALAATPTSRRLITWRFSHIGKFGIVNLAVFDQCRDGLSQWRRFLNKSCDATPLRLRSVIHRWGFRLRRGSERQALLHLLVSHAAL